MRTGEKGDATCAGWWMNVGALLLWIGMILWVASRPSTFFFPPGTTIIPGMPRQVIQYPYHLSAFFILAILFLRCFLSRTDRKGARKSEALSLLGSVLVSISSELIQVYVPTRTPALRDLALDFFGVSLGIIVMRHLSRHAPSPLSSSPTGERGG